MKKIFLALMAGVMLVSCDLNFFPSDETNSDVLLQDPSGAEYIMDGCYAVLKDEVEFLGYSSGNTFVRHYFQMSEFPADNACLSAHTTDDLYQATALVMTDNLKNVGTLWMLAYKVIFMTNSVIENNEEGVSPESDHLLGEAYFVRGWMHLNLVTLFSKPYVQGRDNIGIPLHISTNNPKVTRAKVGDVYDQIVKDLEKAESLMNVKSRGNKGYPSKLTAQGILSRVHLYMGNWEACVNVVDAMLGGKAAADMLDKDFANYFVKAKTSEETLFCIAHEATDTRGQSSIGSMYLKDEIGWGEIYPSYPLMYLYERYPQDLRYTSYIHTQYAGDGNWKVYFPVAAQAGGISEGRANEICAATPDGENFKFTYDGATYTAEKRTIQGEYSEYWVKYKNEDIQVRVDTTITHRKTLPTVYISKFSYQDGDPMLSSPVICRWGEVILNRAEAYAKLGQDAKALEDVNVIRTRAGIPTEGMFAADKMHGYTSALDVVLDERRLELAFEGHRLFDLIRNEKKIDRKFPGAQPWEIVEPTDNRLQYPIPNSEWSVSGIEQNPGY